MKHPIIIAFLVCSLIYVSGGKSYGQARNAIGIGAGLNMPMRNGYKPGRDRVIQAHIRLKETLVFMPTLGWQTIKGAPNGYKSHESGKRISLFFVNAAAKHYFNNRFFGFAGPSYYIGNNDTGSTGLGGSAGGGYDWTFDDYSSLEFSLRADVLPAYHQTVPVAGLRVAYKFNFARKD